MSKCNIGPGGAKKLAQGFSFTSLYYVNLKQNNIGDEGAEAIAIALGN